MSLRPFPLHLEPHTFVRAWVLEVYPGAKQNQGWSLLTTQKSLSLVTPA